MAIGLRNLTRAIGPSRVSRGRAASVLFAAPGGDRPKRERSSRAYPEEPRVGVGAVLLREDADGHASALLIRRGKEPHKGLWSFPGGSLELGETLAACIARETLEETGVAIADDGSGPVSASPSCPRPLLTAPTPFAARDVLELDASGRISFHYTIVNVAASVADPQAKPVAGDDATDARWFPVDKLASLTDGIPDLSKIATEASMRFRPVSRGGGIDAGG